MPVTHLTDSDDPRLDAYRKLKDRAARGRAAPFIVEGRFLVERLIASSFPLESIVLTETRYARWRAALPEADVPVYVLAAAAIRQLVGFDFHAGMLACGRRQPPLGVDALFHDAPPQMMLAVCPRTTDPVNLGSIVRLCAAFGIRGLLLGAGSADPFSRRVLRVSMGYVLHVPIIESADMATDLARLRERHGVHRAALVSDPEAMPLDEATRPARLALLLGNEGDGLDEACLRQCEGRWTIPMAAGTDSLNVAAAAAIAFYQLTRPA